MHDLAGYDYRGLGQQLRPKLEEDGRGWRAIAPEIGVTISDLSRISAGQQVAAHKVIAVCDWAKLSVRAFYHPVASNNVLAGFVTVGDVLSEEMFHGAHTETVLQPGEVAR